MDKFPLKQAKKRDKKVMITEIAIDKVPFLNYQGMEDWQNAVIYKMVKRVLRLSKDLNNSNEVAITYNMYGEELYHTGIAFGNEHEVDLMSDTQSYHIIMSCVERRIVVVHNHPTTQTFSLVDLHFFLKYDNIKMMIVVTNQGKVHYICKETEYNFEEAITLYKYCTRELNQRSNFRKIYSATLEFLARSSEVGLFYF